MSELQFGISIYPGLDNTHEENIWLLKTAAAKGCHRLFTSFHLPETNITAFKKELLDLIAIARKLDYEIISDISHETCNLLDIPDISPAAFKQLGINTLRLDDYCSCDEIATFSQKADGIKIQLNASTITKEFLNKLYAAKTTFSNIDALHNFYPRPETGLSEETLQKKNALLHEYGINTGAFIPSQNRRRSPLNAGLPTLESHRDLSVTLAARHLAALNIDSIFISDSLPSETELSILTTTSPNCITLKAKMLTQDEKLQQFLKDNTFISRIDEARDVIRTQESRLLLKSNHITVEPNNTIIRDIGTVTIDNSAYARYMGELQITKCNLPADERVNVVAKIDTSDFFLIKYITPGKHFRLIF